jgi:ketosteroid isomerase-like protein
MVSVNVELVRSIYPDWERGDYSSTEWADPEIEFVMADGPNPGSWRGFAGLADSTRDFMGAWKNFRIEADDFRELDDGRVLVLVRYGGRGKASGLDIERMRARGAHLYDLRDGKVTRRVTYFDRDRALADLGLTPDADSPRE